MHADQNQSTYMVHGEVVGLMNGELVMGGILGILSPKIVQNGSHATPIM